MKVILIFTLSFFAATCFGQDLENQTSKFSLGLSFSPDYSYRTLNAEANSDDQSIVDFRNRYESPKMGFTTGVRAVYRLNKSWSIEMGLLYSNKGEKQVNRYYVSIDPRKGFITDQDVTAKFYNHYKYLDIPVKANYYITAKRLKLFVSSGLSANVFLRYNAVSHIERADGSEENDKSTEMKLSALNFSAMIGFGAEYQIKDRIHVRLEPEFRHAITSIIDRPIKQYPYSLGANAGIFIAL